MANSTTLPNQAIKDFPMPRLIDDSNKTREEFIAELELALEQVKRGEVYTMDEVKAELTRLYGTKF